MDKEHTNGEQSLTGWRTIAEIGAALGIPFHTVHRVVAHAGYLGASWVTQEPNGRRRWLIDTESAEYQRHSERWREQVAPRWQERRAQEVQFLEEHLSLWDETEDTPGENGSLPRAGDPAEAIWEDLTTWMAEADIAEIWPELCSLLSGQGLVVFSNGLANTHEQSPWQWQWGEAGSGGYQSKRQAILAALEVKLSSAPLPEPPRNRWWHP